MKMENFDFLVIHFSSSWDYDNFVWESTITVMCSSESPCFQLQFKYSNTYHQGMNMAIIGQKPNQGVFLTISIFWPSESNLFQMHEMRYGSTHNFVFYHFRRFLGYLKHYWCKKKNAEKLKKFKLAYMPNFEAQKLYDADALAKIWTTIPDSS